MRATLSTLVSHDFIVVKLYAAAMDGKGREGTYNFFLSTTEGGTGHKAHGAATPPMPKNFLNKAPFPRIKDMYVLVYL